MLYDIRTYTCRPGTVPLHLALYEELGLAAQVRHLGEPVLYALTETGPLNTFTHVWDYRDAEDRARRRAAMEADPEWRRYKEASRDAGYLIAQETRLATAESFMANRG